MHVRVLLVLLIAVLFNTEAAMAATQPEVDRINELSQVRIQSADVSAAVLGQGIVVGRSNNASYVLTAAHVLQNDVTYCNQTPLQANLNIKLHVIGTRKELSGPFSLVGINQCSDLALLEVPNVRLSIGCFTNNSSPGEPLVITAEIADSEYVDNNGKRWSLIGGVPMPGTLKGYYPSGALTYSSNTTQGYSGAGVRSYSSGLLLGMNVGLPQPLPNSPPPQSDDRIGQNTDAIVKFLSQISAPITLTFATNINSADGICLGL
jgi:hypothetical protein